ncbi:MAG TPA: CinA family protein [Nocardioides sp.]|nr:CinA family protein [Nocardioides sp.]
MTNADDLVKVLGDAGLTLATAESLTGGQLAAVLTGVPGSSKVYGGGVVSYATSVKIDVLGVPEELVAEHGVVSAECAAAMAESVRELLGSDVGLSTTGVAGPERQEGKPVGTVFIGVASEAGTKVVPLSLSGDRSSIQRQVVDAAISATTDHVG